MDSEIDNYEVLYCADDEEYRVYCTSCDKLCIEQFYKNHLKSQTHTNNFYKRFRNNLVKRKCIGAVIFVIKLNLKNLEIIIFKTDFIDV